VLIIALFIQLSIVCVFCGCREFGEEGVAESCVGGGLVFRSADLCIEVVALYVEFVRELDAFGGVLEVATLGEDELEVVKRGPGGL